MYALPCREEDGFVPHTRDCTQPGLVFLCSPNNPTGAVLSAQDWRQWVDFAQESGSILICDSAYAAYITGQALPRSVYETEGSENCAIEIGSLSKSAGFTGLRCGWVVLPNALCASGVSLAPLWKRWLSSHSNGVSYPVQRAAEAALSPSGKRQGAAALELYRRNGARIKRYFAEVGIPCWGGEHAPYLWVKCPNGAGSWVMFRRLLEQCGVLCTPGAGFGALGEGYLRFTSFAREGDTAEALRRIKGVL